jgi:hypothetical protein
MNINSPDGVQKLTPSDKLKKASLKSIYNFFRPYTKEKRIRRLILVSLLLTVTSKGLIGAVFIII